MAKKLVIQEKTQEFVNHETGEIIQTTSEKTYSTSISAERFYMTFLDYVAPLYELKSDSLKNLLTYMCDIAEFNTGKVYLTTAARKKLCSDLNISSNTLTNYLGKLKKLNLVNGKDEEFIINPQIFWKGDTSSRVKLLNNESIKITFKLE